MEGDLIVTGWHNNVEHIYVAPLLSYYGGIAPARLWLKLKHDVAWQKVWTSFEIHPLRFVESEVVVSDVGLAALRYAD